jgi:hypothetical protein
MRNRRWRAAAVTTPEPTRLQRVLKEERARFCHGRNARPILCANRACSSYAPRQRNFLDRRLGLTLALLLSWDAAITEQQMGSKKAAPRARMHSTIVTS